MIVKCVMQSSELLKLDKIAEKLTVLVIFTRNGYGVSLLRRLRSFVISLKKADIFIS